MRGWTAVLVVAGLLGGCVRQPPLSLLQAAAIADMHLARHGLDWGPTEEVVALPDTDAAGRSWLAVDYGPDPDTGRRRIVLVNRQSRWARFPGPPAGRGPGAEPPVEAEAEKP